jgi:hypothetical protein
MTPSLPSLYVVIFFTLSYLVACSKNSNALHVDVQTRGSRDNGENIR